MTDSPRNLNRRLDRAVAALATRNKEPGTGPTVLECCCDLLKIPDADKSDRGEMIAALEAKIALLEQRLVDEERELAGREQELSDRERKMKQKFAVRERELEERERELNREIASLLREFEEREEAGGDDPGEPEERN